MNSYTYALNNPIQYIDLDGREPKVFLVARPLDFKDKAKWLEAQPSISLKVSGILSEHNIAAHTFIVIVSDRREPYLNGKQSVVLGFYKIDGKLKGLMDYKADTQWLATKSPVFWVKEILPPHANMSRGEFAQQVIRSFQRLQPYTWKYDNYPDRNQSEANCHVGSTSCLAGAGVDPLELGKLRQPALLDPGLGDLVPGYPSIMNGNSGFI